MEPTSVVVAAPELSVVEAVDTSPPLAAAAIIRSSALVGVEFVPAAIVAPGVLVAASRLVVRLGEWATIHSALEWEHLEGLGLLYEPADRRRVG